MQARVVAERERESGAAGERADARWQPTRAAGREEVTEAPAELLAMQHSDLIEITRVHVEG